MVAMWMHRFLAALGSSLSGVIQNMLFKNVLTQNPKTDLIVLHLHTSLAAILVVVPLALVTDCRAIFLLGRNKSAVNLEGFSMWSHVPLIVGNLVFHFLGNITSVRLCFLPSPPPPIAFFFSYSPLLVLDLKVVLWNRWRFCRFPS
jgi:hypothetical protein